MTVQKAFAGPLELRRRVGTLDAAAIAAMDPEVLQAAFRERPALHRFPGAMATRVQELCAVVARDFDGDAARVWTEARDGVDLEARLRALPGIGEMKAKTLVGLLAKRFGVRPPGWEAVAPTLPDSCRRRLGRGARPLPGAEAGLEGEPEGGDGRLNRGRPPGSTPPVAGS